MTNGRRTWRGRDPYGLSPLDSAERLTRKVVSGWRPDSTDWIRALVRLELKPDVLRPCTLELARLARAHDHVMPSDADWRQAELAERPVGARLALAYVHGHRLRFDLKFQELATVVKRATALGDDGVARDALVRSLEAFAELGLRTPRAQAILNRIPGMSNYDRWCKAVCLHGIGIADHLPDQADRLLRICDEMSQDGEADADVRYWRAFALRRSDRSDRLEEALAEIDRAIEQLPAGRSATHDTYLLERQVIRVYRDLSGETTASADRVGKQFQLQKTRLEQQFAEHRDDLKKELELQTFAARQVLPDSLRSMAIALGVGAVLVAFLVATVALALDADNAWLRSMWVGVILLGGVGLVTLMRRAASPEPRRHGSPPGTGPLRYLGFGRTDEPE